MPRSPVSPKTTSASAFLSIGSFIAGTSLDEAAGRTDRRRRPDDQRPTDAARGVGLGRMGANISRRLMRDGHTCVVTDLDPRAVETLADEGATGAAGLEALVAALGSPGGVADGAGRRSDGVGDPRPRGIRARRRRDRRGNTFYRDDVRRAAELEPRGIRVDCGTSGGVFGPAGLLPHGGRGRGRVRAPEPIFASLAPGSAPAHARAHRDPSTAELGHHRGPVGPGTVKMVHNGIEYGLMASYAEGLNSPGARIDGPAGIRSTSRTSPRCGRQAVSSWLLDLTAAALHVDGDLADADEHVADRRGRGGPRSPRSKPGCRRTC